MKKKGKKPIRPSYVGRIECLMYHDFYDLVGKKFWWVGITNDPLNRLRSDGQRLVLGKRFETLESAEVYADYLAVKCSLEIKDQVLIVHDEREGFLTKLRKAS